MLGRVSEWAVSRFGAWLSIRGALVTPTHKNQGICWLHGVNLFFFLARGGGAPTFPDYTSLGVQDLRV